MGRGNRTFSAKHSCAPAFYRNGDILVWSCCVIEGYTVDRTGHLDWPEGEVRKVKGRRSTSPETLVGDERRARFAGGRATVWDETTLRSHDHLYRPWAQEIPGFAFDFFLFSGGGSRREGAGHSPQIFETWLDNKGIPRLISYISLLMDDAARTPKIFVQNHPFARVLFSSRSALFCLFLPACVRFSRHWAEHQGNRMTVWLSGNALVSINIVTLRRARLVPGWVTAFGRVNYLCM